MNRIKLCATLAVGIAFLTPKISDATILKTMGYEEGTFSNYCGTIVNSPVRSGKKAVKISLNATTKEVNTRCEIPTSAGRVGSEYWYFTSFYFPPDWPDVQQPDARTPHYCLSQWINWKGSGCFPFLFQIWVNPGYKFSAFWYKNDVPSGSGNFGTIKRGAWNDIVVHAKWSLSNTFVEVYLDGKKVWQHSGGMGENCDGTTPSLQYRASLYSQHHYGPARWVIHDEFRMGNASSSLAEITPPKPGSTETVRFNVVNPTVSAPGIRNELRLYSVDGRLIRKISNAHAQNFDPANSLKIELAR